MRIFVLYLVLTIAAFAQALPPGVQKGASIEGITEYTFSNGLHLLLFPDPSNPKVTVNMTVLVGSRHEGYGETGMAHLLEHLLFMRTTGGLGARMPNRIRNLEGLSYSVRSALSVPVTGDGALFSASAISAPRNTPKVEASFKDELEKTLRGGFTAAEVTTAKKAFHDQQMVARSQEQSLLRTIVSRDQAGRTMKWDEQLEAKVQALTVDQINAAFRRHLDPAALTIVKAGDFK